MKKLKNGRFSRSIIFITIMITLLTCCVFGVFARYTTTISGTATLKVAKWDVSVEFTGEKTDFTLIDKDGQETAEYIFTVTNNSDVALTYDVVLTLPKKLPEGITLEIGDSLLTKTNNDLTYTFSNVGIVDVGGKPNNHTLKISSDFKHNSIKIEGIKVSVIATQVAPN